MDIRPILTTLRRHKTAAALIVLEVALTCAILCNAMDLIANRLVRMQRTTGMAESELVMVNITGVGTDANADALTRSDLVALRGLPGVRGVTITNQLPYGGSSWNTGVTLAPDQERSSLVASMYLAGEDFLATTGIRLAEGRDFQPGEYIDFTDNNAGRADPTVILVNRPMAQKLFPDGSALGRTIYLSKTPVKVIGVIERLVSVREIREDAPAMVLPVRMAYSPGGRYLLRTDTAQRDAVLRAAVDTLQRNGPNRVLLERRTFEEMKNRFFEGDRAMARLLVAVCVALLVVTALGIVGLASFWVQQRTRMIGIRRALGATRRQILHYFQLENFLLTSVGVALGVAGAYAANLGLMRHAELTRLPFAYVAGGAVILWLLGQLAVLGPALRAAAVPPVVATRG
ncbi:ABC transporter permease [Caldimonas sp. KR1-144]|uniref:ABC transporter permease n=1 Tax=Caldimonas sp. KR1-144 TaxID=3400911 RepID=UPI003C0D5A04